MRHLFYYKGEAHITKNLLRLDIDPREITKTTDRYDGQHNNNKKHSYFKVKDSSNVDIRLHPKHFELYRMDIGEHTIHCNTHVKIWFEITADKWYKNNIIKIHSLNTDIKKKYG